MLWDCFWGHFWLKAALQFSLLSVRLCMYDSNLYRRPHAMQWPWLKSPNFWVSSAQYYRGLLSLGRGHNVARLDTRVPGSLWHAVRLETSWPGQWLHYLTAVVSTLSILYLIKGTCARFKKPDRLYSYTYYQTVTSSLLPYSMQWWSEYKTIISMHLLVHTCVL